MNKLGIVTWLWRDPHARVKFHPWMVKHWEDMLMKHIKNPEQVQLICITDQVKQVKAVTEHTKVHQIWEPPEVHSRRWGRGRPQCYRRMKLFDPRTQEEIDNTCTHFMSMDLDVVVYGEMDGLWKDWPNFKIMSGSGNKNSYNGSMWMLRIGMHPEVWKRFTPELAVKASEQYMGSDQAWMRKVLGEKQPTWDRSDGCYQFAAMHTAGKSRRKNPGGRLVFFAGAKKPWHAPIQHHYPWIMEAYGEPPDYVESPQGRARERTRQRSRGRRSDARRLEALTKRKKDAEVMKFQEPEIIKPAVTEVGAHSTVWVYDSPDTWGRWFFLEVLKKGRRAVLFKSLKEVGEIGYVFMRPDQNAEGLSKCQEMADELYKRGHKFIIDYHLIQEYEDKGLQTTRYSSHMPATRIFYDRNLAYDFISNPEVFPIVSKSASGSGSKSVRILWDRKQAKEEIETIFSSGFETHMGEVQMGYLIWQEFVTHPYAYRIAKIGDKFFGFKSWIKHEDEPFASGSGLLEDLDEENREHQEVMEFAKSFFRSYPANWIGIDVVRDVEKFKWRVLETTVAWKMRDPDSNPMCHFWDDGRNVAHLYEIAAEQLVAGSFD